MRIKTENKPIEKDFGELAFGEVFHQDGILYMVIDRKQQSDYNAVRLFDGKLLDFGMDALVVPVEGSFVKD